MNDQNWKNLSNELRRRAEQARSSPNMKSPKSPLGIFGGIGGLLLLEVPQCLFKMLYLMLMVVKGILYSRLDGVQSKIYPEGTHFVIPWFQRPIIYDVRAKPKEIASLTGTKDLQMVNITCRVLYKPDIWQLPTIYRTLGLKYEEKFCHQLLMKF